ncbi:MAG: hypothetical protein NDJ90_15045 [Oligoflexia bacterium]|nr:hypothetical protein [Oligoflexia bacterium]
MKLTILKSVRFFPLASVALLSVLWSAGAFASAWGPYVEMTAYPAYTESNNRTSPMGGSMDGSEIKPDTGFSYDLRNTLGVKPVEWLVIGGSFNYASSPMKRNASATVEARTLKRSNQEWGATLGFLMGNWRLMGTYLFSGAKKYSDYAVEMNGTVLSDERYENSLKYGYQFVLGYSFRLSRVFQIGPTLVFRKAVYDSQTKTNNLDHLADYTDQKFTTRPLESNLLPMVTMSLSF